MKTIEMNSPLRAFSKSPISDADELKSLPFFVVRRNLFSRQTIFFVFLALAGLLTLFERFGVILFFSLASFALVQFLLLRRAAQRLQIESYLPEKIKALETLQTKINIFPVPSLGWAQMSVVVHFDGSKQPAQGACLYQSSISGRKITLPFQYKCDAGMGVHDFGPVIVALTDSLGIFEATLTFDIKKTVFVLPKIESVTEIPLGGKWDSHQCGIFE